MPYKNELNLCSFYCFLATGESNSFVGGKGCGESTSTRSKLLKAKTDYTSLQGREIKMFLQALFQTYGD